jgi:Predicted membrane protein (DUF2178)
MKKQKTYDSIIIGAGVWVILFLGIGIFNVVTKESNAWIEFLVSGLSFIYIIYILKRTKNNTNERYEDERKRFVRDKSKSMSFDIIFVSIFIFQLLIGSGKINMTSSLAIEIVLGYTIIIWFISYLICKSKY